MLFRSTEAAGAVMRQGAQSQARAQVANAKPTEAAGAAMSRAARRQARVQVANALLTEPPRRPALR